MVIVSTRKPEFFQLSHPLYEVVTDDGLMHPCFKVNSFLQPVFCSPKDKLEHFKNITAQDIVCSQKSSEVLLKEEDVAVSNVKIDLTRGKD
uniref:Uncharacterized protein n=2 Tax=Zea mays TaxID=4577 RepID=A0A804LNK4_MAIZE